VSFPVVNRCHTSLTVFEMALLRMTKSNARYSVWRHLALFYTYLGLTPTVTNDSYINALSVCELLKKLAALNLTIPITLILDNARYQKCQLVQDLAESLGIELLYLPSYSPNLNLIERLWKFVKKQCLYSKYYEDFTLFQAAISNCVENAHITHEKELKSLLTLRFQSFEKVKVIAV
jgi:transposase